MSRRECSIIGVRLAKCIRLLTLPISNTRSGKNKAPITDEVIGA